MQRIILVVTLALITLAATAPPRPMIVTITKSDGATVRGQLTTADLKAVNVQLLVRGKPEGAQESVPWSDIKSISNGLTRQKVIDQWKKEHADDRCADCYGEGKTFCGSCKGTGRDAAAAKECPACKGELTVACNTPKCDQGKVACPKIHIRLDQGSWYTKDGKKWRKIPGPGGTWEVSEGHVGEAWDPKTGTQAPCQLCAGKFIIDDPKCHGAGTRPCNVCQQAALKEMCAECERGKINCKTCNGTGLKPELLDLPAANSEYSN